MGDYIKKEGKVVGFTASAFDLCHAGHVLMLKEAKNACDYLIVALHDDPSDVADLGYRLETGNKPKNKPIMSLSERKTILEGIKYVDEIIVYRTEAELYDLLKNLKFDVRILGADWQDKKYTGWDIPHKPYFCDRSHGYSTSELRERVYEAERKKREAQEIFAVRESMALDKATMEGEDKAS